MLKILGEHYYLDLDEVEKYINVEPLDGMTGDPQNTISVVRYDMVKILIDTILS